MAETASVTSQENDFILGSSYALEVSFAATIGQGILVWFRWQTTGVTINSITDTAGNVYTAVSGTLVSESERNIQFYLCASATAAHATNFVSASFSGDCFFKC